MHFSERDIVLDKNSQGRWWILWEISRKIQWRKIHSRHQWSRLKVMELKIIPCIEKAKKLEKKTKEQEWHVTSLYCDLSDLEVDKVIFWCKFYSSIFWIRVRVFNKDTDQTGIGNSDDQWKLLKILVSSSTIQMAPILNCTVLYWTDTVNHSQQEQCWTMLMLRMKGKRNVNNCIGPGMKTQPFNAYTISNDPTMVNIMRITLTTNSQIAHTRCRVFTPEEV